MPDLQSRTSLSSLLGLCGSRDGPASDTERFHKACCVFVSRLRTAMQHSPESVFQRVVNSISPRTQSALRESLMRAATRAVTPSVDSAAVAHVVFSLGSGSTEQELLSRLPQYATRAVAEHLAARLAGSGMSLHSSGSVVFRHTQTGQKAHISCGSDTVRVHLSRTNDGWRDAFRLSMAFWNVCCAKEMDISKVPMLFLPPAVTLHMRALTLLYANSCGLKEIPATIDGLQCLEELSVNDNAITELPASLCNLARLRVFSCARNKLKELPNVFFKMTSLETLRVSNNLLVDVPEDHLLALPALRNVDLAGNLLRRSPDRLSESQTLRFVNLSNNTPKLVKEGSLRSSGKMLVTV